MDVNKHNKIIKAYYNKDVTKLESEKELTMVKVKITVRDIQTSLRSLLEKGICNKENQQDIKKVIEILSPMAAASNINPKSLAEIEVSTMPKVKVTQSIADYIEDEQGNGHTAYQALRKLVLNDYDDLSSDLDKQELFVEAWVNGYEIESEKNVD